MALAQVLRRSRPSSPTWHTPISRPSPAATLDEHDLSELVAGSAMVASGAATRVVLVGLGPGAAELIRSIEADLPVTICSLPTSAAGRLDFEIRPRGAAPADV